MLCGPILDGSDVYRAKMNIRGPSGCSRATPSVSRLGHEASREHGGLSVTRVNLASRSSYYYHSLYVSRRKIPTFNKRPGTESGHRVVINHANMSTSTTRVRFLPGTCLALRPYPPSSLTLRHHGNYHPAPFCIKVLGRGDAGAAYISYRSSGG